MLRAVLVVPIFFFSSAAHGQDADQAELLRLHNVIIQAHKNGDLEAWMVVEADTVFASNGGEIEWLSASERRPGREAYLVRSTFDVYEDASAPVVTVSRDGTLGWVLAEVEVRGLAARQDGAIEDFATMYSWIETWKKQEGKWLLTGTVSNSRSLD